MFDLCFNKYRFVTHSILTSVLLPIVIEAAFSAAATLLYLIMAISIVFLFGCTKEIQKWLCHIILVDDADRITNSCNEWSLIVVFNFDTNRFHTICIE